MPSSQNLTELILARGQDRPEAPCIVYAARRGPRTITWAELDGLVRDLLVGWDRLELRKPDCVGLLARNRWEWIACDLAAAGRGLATVSIDPLWSPRHVARIMAHAGVRCVCVDDLDTAKMVLGLRAELPKLRHVVVLDELADTSLPDGVITLSALVAAGRAARRASPTLDAAYMAEVEADDIATIIHTGGSTGQPKGVLRTHGNAVSRGWAGFAWMGSVGSVEPGDRLLDPLSFSHSAGRWWYQTALAHGVELALPSAGGLSMAELQQLAPTHMATVPRVVIELHRIVLEQVGDLWAQLRRSTEADPLERELAARVRALLGGRLRHIVWGGAPLAASTEALFERAGIVVAGGYGGTEPGIVAIRRQHDPRGSVGPAVGADLRIVDGEIWLRGPGVTVGYLDNPEAKALGFAEDGWWRTGDAGRLDSEGNLYVLGRMRAMFNCSEGTNIDPTELEQLLETQPGVAQAILVGHRRAYLAALLAVDRSWLAARAIADPREHLERTLAQVNEGLEDFERIRRFHVIEGEFAPALRQRTIANKVRINRDAVASVYGEVIERLYSP